MTGKKEKPKTQTHANALFGPKKKEKPKRKLPKKSKRAKRRYILFSLKEGFCPNSKKAFDLVMSCFSQSQKKELGVWFIEFEPSTSKGILRCHLKSLSTVKKCLRKMPKESGFKTLKTSGTLKALKGK